MTWANSLPAQEIEELLAGLTAEQRAEVEHGMKETATNWPTPDPEHETQRAFWKTIRSRVEGWEPTIPLTAARDLPDFPTEGLPSCIGEMVDAVAIATQTPTALPALVALSSVALAVAGKVEVEVRDGWREVLALYVMIGLPPSNRKSAVLAELTRALHEWERERADAMRSSNESLRQRRKVIEQTLEAKRRTAANAAGSDRVDALGEVDQLACELAETPEATDPRLLVADATPERIASLLAENGGRLGVFCPEGAALLRILAGAYSRDGSSNLHVLQSAYTGEPVRVDRVSRPSVHVPRPVLVTLLLVQESVLISLREHPDFISQGLLSRFILARPASLLGSRVADAPAIPSGIANVYRDRLRSLLELTPAQNERGDPVPHVLKLTDGARRLLYGFHDRLEPRLGPGGDLEREAHWVGKAVGLAARLAGILHLAERARDAEPWAGFVSEDSVRPAIQYTEHVLMPHALAVLALIDEPPEVRLAGKVLAWIRRKRLQRFSARDLHRDLVRNVGSPSDWHAPLRILEDTGHVRLVPSDYQGKGRRRAPEYEANPIVIERGCGSES